jgi:hypothetical protein
MKMDHGRSERPALAEHRIDRGTRVEELGTVIHRHSLKILARFDSCGENAYVQAVPSE